VDLPEETFCVQKQIISLNAPFCVFCTEPLREEEASAGDLKEEPEKKQGNRWT
jgi:hypothetical protein